MNLDRSFFEQLLLRAVAAVLFTTGCLFIVIKGLSLPVSLLLVTLSVVLYIGIMTLLSFRPKIFLLLIGAFIVGLLLFALFIRPNFFSDITTELMLLSDRIVSGMETGAISNLAVQLLVFLFCLLCFPLFRVRMGAFPSMTMLALIAGWFCLSTQDESLLIYVALALLGVVMLYGYTHIDILQSDYKMRITALAMSILILAPFIVGIALLLTPQTPSRFEPLASRIDELVDIFQKEDANSVPRTPYNSRLSGLQPLGVRLGGPVSLSDSNALKIIGDVPTLLRGTMRNHYDGSSWSDTLPSRRYPCEGWGTNSQLSKIFDLNKPQPNALSEEEEASAFIETQYTIRMLTSSSSTLFVPNRLLTFTPPEESTAMAPYFNLSGELFLLSNVPENVPYVIQSRLVNRGWSGLADLIAGLDRASDADYNDIRKDYTQIPENMPDALPTLVESLTEGLSPYEQAVAIERYLQRNFTYTLTPEAPPVGQDFVSWFLFESQSGYCTYYASSMAIMARYAGLPTRYVEGYSMNQPPENGAYYLSNQNAHAWVEVYFKGFGWVPFDPTPGDSGPMNGNGAEPETTPDPEASPTPDPEAEAGETPIPEETSEMEEDPFEGVEPEPEEDPTPEPTGGDSLLSTPLPPGVTPDPSQQTEPNGQSRFQLPPWVLVLAGLIAIGALVVVWYRQTFPYAHRQEPNPTIMRFYNDILRMLAHAGLPMQVGETAHQYAARVDEDLELPGLFTNITDVTMGIEYGAQQTDATDLAAIHVPYTTIADAIQNRVGKIRYRLIRFTIPPTKRISPPEPRP